LGLKGLRRVAFVSRPIGVAKLAYPEGSKTLPLFIPFCRPKVPYD
jgi:hypothetical protein